MRSVLGIDAAWTEHRPSGVALLRATEERWECVASASSYEGFLARGGVEDVPSPADRRPRPDRLLTASRRLLEGCDPDVVTVDMPMATTPIRGRRVADDATASAFGRPGCGTHSPGVDRPGRVGSALTRGFESAGYALGTAGTTPGDRPRLLEVYPCTALLALTGASVRLPYKVARSTRYWPGTSVRERIALLLAQWRRIVAAIRRHVHVPDLAIPRARSIRTLASLKPYEDRIDALVCGWVGTRYLRGDARAFGDETAAIWTP